MISVKLQEDNKGANYYTEKRQKEMPLFHIRRTNGNLLYGLPWKLNFNQIESFKIPPTHKSHLSAAGLF